MQIFANEIDKNGKKRKSKKINKGNCVFPFKYKGSFHNECIQGESGNWCATSLTKNGSVDTWGFCQNQKEKDIEEKSKENEVEKRKSSSISKEKITNYYTNIEKDGIIRHYKNINDKSSKSWSIGFINTENGWILKSSWGKLGGKQREKFYIGEDLNKAQQKLNDKLKEGYIPSGVSFYFDISNIIPSNEKDKDIVEKYLEKILIKKTKKTKKSKKKLSNKISSKSTKELSKNLSSSSKTKSNSIMEKEFDREKRIKELKEKCIDPYDGILYEGFEDWEDNELQDAILIGPDGNKRCYKVSSIYRWIEESIKAGKPLKDPINISYEITEEELKNIKNIMRKNLGDKYISPKHKKIVLDEKNVELLISDPNDTWKTIPKHYVPNYHGNNLRYPFYHIEIKITIPGRSRAKIIDLGYIPAGIEPMAGEDQYLSSYSLVSSVRKLWDMRKLLTVHHPLKDIKCCSVELNKPVQYWFKSDGRLDINKVSEFGADLRYQELM